VTRRSVVTLMAAGVIALSDAGPARADDVRVDTDTTLQAYDVQSPASSVVWARRRLTQTLSLRYVKPLGEPTGRGPAPSLQLHVRLRLDQDFGDTCLTDRRLCYAIVNPERRGSYTPVVDEGGIDLPAAYLEARDLPLAAEIRTGRQLHVDEVGFVRFDGVSARVAPRPWLAFEAAAGALVRRTSVAGVDAFNAGSLTYLDLDPEERARVSEARYDVTTWLASLSCELGSEELLRARVSARALHERGGFVEQRLALGLASRLTDPVRLEAHGVLDVLDPALIDTQLGAELRAPPWGVQLHLEHHQPRFEPSTIWAYFDVAPVWLATLAGQVTITPALLASLGVRGRRTELEPAAEHDLGLDGTISLFDARDSVSLTGFGWLAERGPLWGASLLGSRRVTAVVSVEAEVSLFRVDDPLRTALRGLSLQELLATRVEISDESSVRLVATHTYGQAVSHRLSLLFFLHLGVWR